MATNPRRARRPVFTSSGYALTGCECCKEMVHDDGSEVLDKDLNWVRTCAECGLRVCLVYMPEAATVCVGCQHARDSLKHPEVPTTTS